MKAPSKPQIPPRVLIIDNEPLVRWSLTRGLINAGFDAVSAASRDEACALASLAPRPLVVLLDSRLHGADPRALLHELRALSPSCRFLVLAVEGQDVSLPPWDEIRIIRKPFDLHDVVRRVRAAVR